MVKDDSADAALKRRETTGPKILRGRDAKALSLKTLYFTQAHPDKPKSKLQELLDAEEELEENRLKAQGRIIGDLVASSRYLSIIPD